MHLPGIPSQDLEPSSLPPIDALEIVLLEGISPNALDDIMQRADGNPKIQVSGPPAQDIANFWRQLPHATQMRCHLPRFGLRFYACDEWLLEASVCWECNNVYGRQPSGKIHFGFDASSAPAVALLDLVRAHAPAP